MTYSNCSSLNGRRKASPRTEVIWGCSRDSSIIAFAERAFSSSPTNRVVRLVSLAQLAITRSNSPDPAPTSSTEKDCKPSLSISFNNVFRSARVSPSHRLTRAFPFWDRYRRSFHLEQPNPWAQFPLSRESTDNCLRAETDGRAKGQVHQPRCWSRVPLCRLLPGKGVHPA